jgi:hypothetical protein
VFPEGKKQQPEGEEETPKVEKFCFSILLTKKRTLLKYFKKFKADFILEPSSGCLSKVLNVDLLSARR